LCMALVYTFWTQATSPLVPLVRETQIYSMLLFGLVSLWVNHGTARVLVHQPTRAL